MAVTLRADNRVLVQNAKLAYLIQNYESGTSQIVVTNTEPFSVDTPILLGEMASTDAEILKVDALAESTKTITLGDINSAATYTAFSHPESTKVVALPYDQIRFYWTAALGTIADETPTFADTTPLTGWTDLDPTSWYTTYSDTAHSTGFGWFKYRNATTLETSDESNPIPYAGFVGHTVQQVFADFDSLLNTKELTLVSMNDRFAWLNEALAIFRTKLNLTNTEYTVSSTQTLTAVSGTAEYELPSDFADLIEIVSDSDDLPVPFLPVSEVLAYIGSLSTTTHYYLRGRYIGLVPTPTASATYSYRYKAKASRVSSLSTYLDLPDNAFYSLKDYMMYRAYLKFSNPLATTFYQSFKNAMDFFIQSAVKRSANLDTWGIADSANT